MRIIGTYRKILTLFSPNYEGMIRIIGRKAKKIPRKSKEINFIK